MAAAVGRSTATLPGSIAVTHFARTVLMNSSGAASTCNTMIDDRILGRLAEIGASEYKKSYYFVRCEHCEFARERWTEVESQILANVHRAEHSDHEVVFERQILMDSERPELGFEESTDD